MKRHLSIFAFVLGIVLTVCTTAIAQEVTAKSETTAAPVKKKKKSFGQMLLAPIKWIGKNWSDYDPDYSLPSFYDWATHLQNTTTFEWVNMKTPQGIDLSMHSKVSNNIGPYLGYRFLFYGYTVDLNTIGKPKGKGKNEFTLSINSNLANIDLIRRRTGGDFTISKLALMDPDDPAHPFDMGEFFKGEDEDLGDYAKNSLTGINVNIFTNHRKYSNPAAFSNGAVQLRSAGSPILGMGYTHQKVSTESADLFGSMGMLILLFRELGSINFDEDDTEDAPLIDDDDDDGTEEGFQQMLERNWPQLSSSEKNFLCNRVPTVTTINDWHLQLGYAYNLVFSRRLLLGLSAIVSPGIKWVKSNNYGSITYELADMLSDMSNKYDGKHTTPDDFRYNFKDTHFNLNTFLRASLTFNYNRWRAGINATFSNYLYNNGGMRVNNGFGSITTYVGYCFGRNKSYRHDGDRRQEYIMAALTKRQIEEMKDTMPQGNVAPHENDVADNADGDATLRYHRDEFDLGIIGCDLVTGPEGKYGWFEITDGYVTPGEDSEGRLSAGRRLDIDKEGRFVCEAGHNGNFRTGNWWKSQLAINQIPNSWYPEMLHYALRGNLTLYLRGRIFGTRKPVKVVISDFCINHGHDTRDFMQVGIKSFKSSSPYSIEGRVSVNDRECRLYVEQKKRGKLTNLYFSRIHPDNAVWMDALDDNRPISTISMPGTHDAGSAAAEESPVYRYTHTQIFNLTEQLYDGIRAFDIRLKRDLRYSHAASRRENFDSTMVAWDRFLHEHPSEFIVALIGSDEGGKWGEELTQNFQRLVDRYPHRFVQNFKGSTKVGDVRGKILVIRRQEGCPFGKLLQFQDNAVFEDNGFCVENVSKEFKTYRKIKLMEKNIRDAYENDDPDKWYITFASTAWSPRRHTPYSYAWGAKNIRKPINKSMREFIELKDYVDFGMVFLDFYNDHGDSPQIVKTIIDSNFHHDD